MATIMSLVDANLRGQRV